MTLTMWDTITGDVGQIPADAEAVAGYVTGPYRWTPAEWSLFAGRPRAEIAVRASHDAGNVLDCETGDATPDQCPGWVQRRRMAGVARPVVYCTKSQWPAVRAAFAAQGVPEPDWWIASWTGSPHCPAGAVACQWADPNMLPAPFRGRNLDVTLVADPTWLLGWQPTPGPTPVPSPSPTPITGGAMPAAPLAVVDPQGRGYWHILPDGTIHPFGVPVWGDLTGVALAAPIVDADVMPAGDGLVLLGRDGGVFAYGSAQPHGNPSPLGAVCTAIRLTSTGAGYYVASQDGGLFAYGDARFLGHA